MPDLIDSYVAELAAALGGPRRVRADLVTEARDSLVDATERWQQAGLEPSAAKRRAVDEFGPLDEIAAGYRTELDLARAKRTVWLFAAVLLPQPVIWAEGRWPWNSAPMPAADRPVVVFLQTAIEWTGMGLVFGALLALAACGVGLRWPAVRRRAAIVAAGFALVASASMLLAGLVLSAGSATDLPGMAASVGWALLLVLAPMAVVMVTAARCLRDLIGPMPIIRHK
jgi:hypothetical protein